MHDAYPDKNNTTGERIRRFRKGMNLTQSDFANYLGINQGHLSKIERGIIDPSTHIIRSICISFNIDEKWLRNGIGKDFQQAITSDDLLYDIENLKNISKQDVLNIIAKWLESLHRIDIEYSKLSIANVEIDNNLVDTKVILKRLEVALNMASESIQDLLRKARSKRGD